MILNKKFKHSKYLSVCAYVWEISLKISSIIEERSYCTGLILLKSLYWTFLVLRVPARLK